MINPDAFIHPEDATAMKTLKTVPGMSYAFKQFLKFGYEKMLYGENLASSIKLSKTQLPRIYRMLPPICDMLGMQMPEFYLQMNPMPNAYSFGDTYKFICVTSGLVEMLEEDEIYAVLAHECGHIICRHALYHTMAQSIAKLLKSEQMNLSKELLETVRYALLYWLRKSELSCDRVSAVVTSPETVSRVMVRLSGGPKSLTQDVDLAEWAAQADAYHKLYHETGFWDRTMQTLNTIELDHPYAAVRVSELYKWANTSQYDKAKSLLITPPKRYCPDCGQAVEYNAQYCEWCGAEQ